MRTIEIEERQRKRKAEIEEAQLDIGEEFKQKHWCNWITQTGANRMKKIEIALVR